MRGIGGPLLCIGDLLSDVGEEGDGIAADSPYRETTASSSVSNLNQTPPISNLTQLFQENFEHLNEAIVGTDHCWTALTLKLCTALEAANQLVQSTNSNVALLSEKVGILQKIIKKGDSAIAVAKAVHITPDNDRCALIDNKGFK